MNKTVNINLGGLFFHIDEDAYQKLTRYFDAIRRSLNNASGQDEIIKDIEMRIAELIAEKHTHDKQVISAGEVDEIITVMGQPEDYRIDDEDQPKQAPNFDYVRKSHKLYRDTDNAMLGGVCTGLGHYFGVDPVWIRVAFAILLLGFGVGLIPYIVLWIAMPAALTTAEKLEMQGQPVTISNIERKVREEFDAVSQRIKNTDYDRLGRQAKTSAERAAANIGAVFTTIFKVFAKILGGLIVLAASGLLIALIIGLFTLGSSTLFDVPWLNYAEAVNYSEFPIWIIIALTFLAAAIPLFAFFVLGFKLLVPNLRPLPNILKYTLLALWLVSVGMLTAFAVKAASENAYDGKVTIKENLSLAPTDTLRIKFRYSDYYAKGIEDFSNVMITQDEKGKEVIYSNNVHFHLLKSDQKQPYLQIEKQARGASLVEARSRAGKISYGYRIEGSQIILDDYLLTEPGNRLRNQHVEIYLYLPQGVLLRPDTASLQHFDDSDNYFFDLHFSGDYLYRVEKDQVKCLDCPPDENDYGDNGRRQDSTSTTTLTIGKATLKIEKNGKMESHDVKTLDINPDGIVVKTN
jgi:phage shock protein PspC (stress-responsive transcriptional regulator)